MRALPKDDHGQAHSSISSHTALCEPEDLHAGITLQVTADADRIWANLRCNQLHADRPPHAGWGLLGSGCLGACCVEGQRGLCNNCFWGPTSHTAGDWGQVRQCYIYLHVRPEAKPSSAEYQVLICYQRALLLLGQHVAYDWLQFQKGENLCLARHWQTSSHSIEFSYFFAICRQVTQQ